MWWGGGVDFSVSNHTHQVVLQHYWDRGLCVCDGGMWTFALDFLFWVVLMRWLCLTGKKRRFGFSAYIFPTFDCWWAMILILTNVEVVCGTFVLERGLLTRWLCLTGGKREEVVSLDTYPSLIIGSDIGLNNRCN